MVGACMRIAARGRTTVLLAALCAAAFAAGTFTFAPGVARGADAADASKALADYLIAQTTHAGGVVALPRCGDGRLAAALADRADGPLVYAADARDAQYDAARKLAADAGLLGRTLYVQKAPPAHLPLADNYADLVILTDLTDADLQADAAGAAAAAAPAPLLSEILRLLVPLNGRAVVGRAKSATGKGNLTRDDLTKTPDWRRRQLPRDLEDKERKASEVMRQWGPLPLDVNSLVMTPSSVVVAWGVKNPRVGGPPVNWFLGALKLDDGATLWQTPLPAEPVTGAMTVDRDGRILLALRDGRVVCWAGPK